MITARLRLDGDCVTAAMTAFAAPPASNASLFKFTPPPPPPDSSCRKHDIAEPCVHLAPEVTA